MHKPSVIMHVDKMLKVPRVVGSDRQCAARSPGASPNSIAIDDAEMHSRKAWKGKHRSQGCGYRQTFSVYHTDI